MNNKILLTIMIIVALMIAVYKWILSDDENNEENKEEDKEIIERIYKEHIKNPDEFWTDYPFPATAISDPYWINLKNPPNNCWGYYTQTITLFRCIPWMDYYGFGEDFDEACRRWLKAYTDSFEEVPFGQEIHPITGKPTTCSPYASSSMMFYCYVVDRLGILK